ncbi:RNA polymerase sigma factor [Granulosicoccus sp.]|nr:RNA polymerase sigma factor [Granulosicoccus sp.]MDB4224267.1 RNA polymerase sigma factor [Granulosicoccus sp.]
MNQDSEHISHLLESELDTLWRFAWRLTGHPEDAADLMQRTCLRVLERADQYQARGKFRSWLMRITHRIWINEIRSRNIRQQRSFGPSAGHSETTISEEASAVDGEGFIQPESNIMLHQVHDAVESLPEAQRLVMLLVSVEGYSYREAAEILEVPIGTIMSRLARARLIIGKRMLRVDQNNNKSSKGSEVLK